MEINDIIKLIEAVSEHGLTSFVLEENGSKISMKKEKEIVSVSAPAVQTVIAPGTAMPQDAALAGLALQPVFASSEAAMGAGAAAQPGSIGSDKVVTSPLVGTFYNSPSPESAAFVSVGDTVKKGQLLLEFDIQAIREAGYDITTPVVVTNTDDFQEVEAVKTGEVHPGEEVLRVW